MYQTVRSVYRRTGKMPCEIWMHPVTYRNLEKELGPRAYKLWIGATMVPPHGPRFEGIPIHVDAYCKRHIVYFPTEPFKPCA